MRCFFFSSRRRHTSSLRDWSSDVCSSDLASGFANGNAPPDHLPGHTTFDFSAGKEFGDKWSVAINSINVANRRVLLDNSFTFGGTHYLNPRELFVQVRYRF